ncbi:glycosyltransferase family 4 protein [soil metagenome]
MRVLMTIAEMGSGGAETLVAELATALGRSGHEVAVGSSGGWREEQLRGARGVTCLRVPLRDPGPLSLGHSVARLAAQTHRSRPDVVHAHNVRASAVARLAVSRWPGQRPPMVTTVHGLAAEDYPRAARMLRWSADLVVAVSDSVRTDLVRAGYPATRTRLIENAVARGERHRRDQVRASLDLPSSAFVAVCVARLAPPKRHDLLLEAWARLGSSEPILLVVGDGPNSSSLRDAAEQLGIRHRVRFLGTRTDVARLHAAADVAVLSSDREGLPLAVLEAMEAGVPVVASDVGGLTGLGAAIELVAPGSTMSLVAALEKLRVDLPRRAELARAARASVSARFAPEAMQAAYHSVYTHVRQAPAQQRGRRM